MDISKLTEQTIFLNSFFSDVENDMIYFDEDDNVLIIEKDSDTYQEFLSNLTDLTLSSTSKIGRVIQRRMLSTVIQYYNTLADTNYTDICIRSIER